MVGGPPRVTMIIVIGADSKGGHFSKIFPVLDLATSKENIKEALEVGGTLVEVFASGLVDKEVVLISMLTATGGHG